MNINKIRKSSAIVAQLLKTLSHPTRLLILSFLIEGEKSVGELEELCQVSQSQMSQFLKKMEGEGLLSSKREGKFIYYTVKDAKVFRLLEKLHELYG